MRATAILPLACAALAFLLSMLVLFAGDSPKFLPTVELLRVRLTAQEICLFEDWLMSASSIPPKLARV